MIFACFLPLFAAPIQCDFNCKALWTATGAAAGLLLYKSPAARNAVGRTLRSGTSMTLGGIESAARSGRVALSR